MCRIYYAFKKNVYLCNHIMEPITKRLYHYKYDVK